MNNINYFIEKHISDIKRVITYRMKKYYTLKGLEEDILGEVILVIFKCYKKFDKTKPIENFFYGITENVIKNEFRKSQKHKYIDISLYEAKLSTHDNTNIEYKNMLTQLEENFNESDWILFIEYFLNENSHSEIANNYNLTVGTSRQRKMRLKLRAQEILKNYL